MLWSSKSYKVAKSRKLFQNRKRKLWWNHPRGWRLGKSSCRRRRGWLVISCETRRCTKFWWIRRRVRAARNTWLKISFVNKNKSLRNNCKGTKVKSVYHPKTTTSSRNYPFPDKIITAARETFRWRQMCLRRRWLVCRVSRLCFLTWRGPKRSWISKLGTKFTRVSGKTRSSCHSRRGPA